MSNKLIKSQNYRIDDKGNTIWFPYSYWGKGYVLDEEAKEVIRQDYSNPVVIIGMIFTPVYIGLILLLCWQFNLPQWVFLVSMLVPVIGIAVYGRILVNKRVAALDVSNMRLSFTDWLHPELMKNYEGNFGACVVGLIIAALSLYISIADGLLDPNRRNLGIAGISLSLIWGYLQFRAAKYLMYVKHHKKD